MRLSSAMVWLLAIACGRVGFDAMSVSDDDGGASAGDAGPTPCPGSTCAAAGGSCMGGDCVIVVTGTGPITCPPGLSCVIECEAMGSCSSGIDCSMASSCTVGCNVGGSCQGGLVDCDGGGCTLFCAAQNTCTNMSFSCAMPCLVECCASLTCNGLSGPTTLDGSGECPP